MNQVMLLEHRAEMSNDDNVDSRRISTANQHHLHERSAFAACSSHTRQLLKYMPRPS